MIPVHFFSTRFTTAGMIILFTNSTLYLYIQTIIHNSTAISFDFVEFFLVHNGRYLRFFVAGSLMVFLYN